MPNINIEYASSGVLPKYITYIGKEEKGDLLLNEDAVLSLSSSVPFLAGSPPSQGPLPLSPASESSFV